MLELLVGPRRPRNSPPLPGKRELASISQGMMAFLILGLEVRDKNVATEFLAVAGNCDLGTNESPHPGNRISCSGLFSARRRRENSSPCGLLGQSDSGDRVYL